jgi:multiple sugar transport system substrate-binding protein
MAGGAWCDRFDIANLNSPKWRPAISGRPSRDQQKESPVKKSHISAATALAVAVGLLASGCSSASEHDSGNSTTITFWNHKNPSTQPVDTALIGKYESEHPNIKINYLTIDDASLPTKLNTAMAGGAAPDLFNSFQAYGPGLLAKNQIAPVDLNAFGVTGTDELESMFSKASIDGFTMGGQPYAIPHEVSSYAFWVNGAQFKKAGLDPQQDFPKTYADVVALAQKLQASGAAKEGLVQTLNNPVREMLVLDAMAKQAGGSLFSADGKTALLDSPAVVKALDTWGGFVHASKINDPALGPTATTVAENYFGDGTAAMTNIGGSWLIPNLKSKYPATYSSYVVGQYPTFGTNEVGGDLYGYGLYVSASSEKKAEAWKFARFLSDNGQAYFDQAGVWLGDKSTVDSPSAKKSANWDVFSEAFNRGTFLAPVTNFDELGTVVERAIQRVVLENQSATDSLKQAQSEAQPLMQ